jgi:hypothetical protein
MDLLSDIPDFVRSEICCAPSSSPSSSSSMASPFWQKWNELGSVVEKIVTPETSFQELTLRDLLASLPLNSVQATDANGFWSSSAFSSNFKFTTHPHFVSTAVSSSTSLLFVLESPCIDVDVQKKIVKIPRITNAATFVFLLQHFHLGDNNEQGRKRPLLVPSSSLTVQEMEMDEGAGGGDDDEEVVSNVTYSATNVTHAISSLTPLDAGILKTASASTVTDIDSCLQRWKRGETNGRTGKPTVEKIAEMAGMTQLDLKKWLAAKNTTWTQMLITHGFRDGGKS